jgi:pimeloyl-ACP methyl ester carboxylesterase
VIGKAGHCPQIEQPSAANDLLLDFLAEVQRKVSA